ncbi:MAG: glycoside hydrolase family 130 protein [Caldisericaceae bacterium]|nr:glycoside hydrolase family 130 protein [Caldisericaceae bacterium]
MLKRYQKNPILTRKDIPNLPPNLVDVSSVFNPGAIKFKDQYILLLRVQNRGRETFTLKATSQDGIHFKVAKNPVIFEGLEKIKEKIYHVYDPRLTMIEGVCYIMFAMDMDDGCKLGLAITKDFETFEFMDIVGRGDVRNGVLFPEKIGGKYIRLERPNRQALSGGIMTGTEIWLSSSDDLLHWKEEGPVMKGRFHYWDETIGSGPPPIKTKEGWLHIYHGVAHHFGSASVYQAGAVLLDLNDPQKVLARTRQNILEPRELYELTGQVPNVVFPSGMICESYDEHGFALSEAEIKVYYGAADTVAGLATSKVQELIDRCKTE